MMPSNDDAGYFLDKLGFTGGKRVVGWTRFANLLDLIENATNRLSDSCMLHVLFLPPKMVDTLSNACPIL